MGHIAFPPRGAYFRLAARAQILVKHLNYIFQTGLNYIYEYFGNTNNTLSYIPVEFLACMFCTM